MAVLAHDGRVRQARDRLGDLYSARDCSWCRQLVILRIAAIFGRDFFYLILLPRVCVSIRTA